MNTRIVELLLEVKKEFEGIKDIDEKVKMLNLIRTNIADISPFEEPVDCVRWIPADKVKANEYNP